jgi:Ran GTPase-activating protein (RanGAP) involved in mRNA processing and transport
MIPAMSAAAVAGRTCQVPGHFVPCDAGELRPLLDFLAAGGDVARRTAFPRGTLLPDGRLDLCKQRLGPGGAAAIAAALHGNPHVRHLLMGADGLGDSGANAVAALVEAGSAVETVYLGCNFITAEGAAKLADAVRSSANVTGLWLKRNPIGDEGAAELATMLARNRSLRTLDLTQTGITAAGLRSLVDALIAHPTNLERLYLSGNRFGPAEAEILADLLRAPTALRHLFVSVNRLGDDGARRLLAAERANPRLRTLGLASNGLGSGAAEALAAVADHPALERLDLGREPSAGILGERDNLLGDDGARTLAEMLPGQSSLRLLNLEHNGITDAGAGCLAEGLAGNATLIELRLDRILGRHRRRQIEELLLRNRRASGLDELPPDPAVSAIRSVYRV